MDSYPDETPDALEKPMITAAFAASLAFVVTGVALVSVPVAFVVAGVLLCALVVLHERGAE